MVGLSNNQLDYGSVEILIDALHENTALTRLEIYDLSFTKHDSEEVRALADILDKNSCLISLNLSNCKLDFESVKILAETFCKNTTLTSLDFPLLILVMRKRKYFQKSLTKISQYPL
ncbi:Protein phosphatase 1 regulatory subunit 37 [Gigaspora margarita]|uniref:Protein phosphatase 1 regulatory subunit 37 n=1 Tax=Gigaspora margarita TaxID=4874 RepID=A0A8H4B3R2_GIGMA|nr:Protein phosphatase 1 regulatory subunit 37 [Gigaspora margarita]